MLSSITRQSIRSFSSSASRSTFAKMQLLGTVGSVNNRETRDGVPFINYSLAVNRFNPQGSIEENNRTVTDWFNISVFNEKHVNSFNSFLKPGVQLYVECDVRQRVVTDENDENKQTFTSLKQVNYDVVRFAKKTEEVVEEE